MEDPPTWRIVIVAVAPAYRRAGFCGNYPEGIRPVDRDLQGDNRTLELCHSAGT